MSEEQNNTSRRGFLRTVALTGAAATLAGAGAAIVAEEYQGRGNPVISSVTTDEMISQSVSAPSANTVVDNSDLVTQLATTKAENVRLQTELTTAQQRIADLEAMIASGDTTQADLQMQLSNASSRISVLGGLIALYEQLDDVNLGNVVSDGMSVVGDRVTDLVDDLPVFSTGLDAGRQLLDKFEGEVPAMHMARNWMLLQVGFMGTLFATVLLSLEAAVERSGPLLDLIGEWARNVLKWLPFGLGEKTSNLIDAMTELLDATPELVDGAETEVATPWAMWLGSETDLQFPVIDEMVTPLRTRVFDSAETTLTKVSNVDQAYKEQLSEPVAIALYDTRAIKESITTYREQYQL